MNIIKLFFEQYPLVLAALYIVTAILGMIVHFLKLDISGQTLSDIKQYFIGNFKYTLWATVVTIVFSTSAWWMGQGLMSAFLVGYTFDSLLNRGPGDTLTKTGSADGNSN